MAYEAERKEKYGRAAEVLRQARHLHDSYEGKDMPLSVANQVTKMLNESKLLRSEADEMAPEYKHDMTWSLGREYGAGDVDEAKGGVSSASVKAIAAFARGAESKAALVEDTDGQRLVPTDWAGSILKDLSREGVIRSQATVRPTNRRTVTVGSVNVASASWGKLELGDTAADGLGTPPTNPNDVITVWDLNALVKLGVDELEDTDAGLEDMIRQAVVSKMAEQEDDAFAVGTGDAAKMPLGFAADTTVTQGKAAAAEATLVADDLMDLPYQVPGWARRNGAYYAHSSVERAAALLKNSAGDYLWRPSTAAGLPATWNGRPWYTVDGLPAMTATGTTPGDKSVFFGDMKAAYMIADRRKITVQRLNERFIDAGQVGLLFRSRVGGRVLRPLALAWLKL